MLIYSDAFRSLAIFPLICKEHPHCLPYHVCADTFITNRLFSLMAISRFRSFSYAPVYGAALGTSMAGIDNDQLSATVFPLLGFMIDTKVLFA